MFIRLFLIILIFSLSLSQSAHACQLKIRTYPSTPLAIQSADKSWSGIDIDYARAFSTALGCEANFVVAPWARSLTLLKNGDVDMMVNVTKSPKREQDYYFIGPQRYETIRLVSIDGAFKEIASWRDFATLDAVLMRQKGSLFDVNFEKALDSNHLLKSKLVELSSNVIRMTLLKKARIDGTFVDEYILYHHLQTDKSLQGLKVHPLVLSRIPVYFAFSKKRFSSDQIAQYEQVFERLIQTPEYKLLGEVKGLTQ